MSEDGDLRRVRRGWLAVERCGSVVRRNNYNCSTLSPVSTGIGDRLRAGGMFVTKLTTQPCIPSGSLNRVPALIGWGKSKSDNATSAG